MSTLADPIPTAIDAHGLARRFGPIAALAGVDLVVPPGGIAVVLGPNGAGKTTLLRGLAGLLAFDAGSALVAGVDVRHAPAAARRRIGFVTHRPLVYPDLTAEENLRFHARLYGTPADPEHLAAALGAVGLARRRHQRAGAFSHGLRRRLAIAQALWHDPDVLLLDEPHAGLDPAAADWLDATLVAAARGGRTILMTTHDLDRAQALADQVTILQHGRVAWSGHPSGLTPDDLRAKYDAVTRGVSVPEVAPPELPLPAQAESRRSELPAAHPPSLVQTMLAIVWKDLRVELRAREILPPVLVFALLVVVIFQFALPAAPAGQLIGTPGALWVALLFGSTLGLARALGVEIDGGGMTGLVLAPIDRGAIFLGKWLSGWLFSLAVAACLLLVCTAWLNLPPARLPALMGVLALGLVGWGAAGTLLAAMAASTRAREVLLPVLLYPVVLPLVIPAVRLTELVLATEGAPAADLWPLVTLIAAYDVILMVLGFLLFPYVVAEAG